MGSSKRIIYRLDEKRIEGTDVNVCKSGEGLAEFFNLCGISFDLLSFLVFSTSFFLNVKAQVLEKHNLSLTFRSFT